MYKKNANTRPLALNKQKNTYACAAATRMSGRRAFSSSLIKGLLVALESGNAARVLIEATAVAAKAATATATAAKATTAAVAAETATATKAAAASTVAAKAAATTKAATATAVAKATAATATAAKATTAAKAAAGRVGVARALEVEHDRAALKLGVVVLFKGSLGSLGRSKVNEAHTRDVKSVTEAIKR